MSTLIPFKTVIGMDIGKKYSWCEAISTETRGGFETGKVPKQEKGSRAIM